ncbi:hypothetical protein OTK49_21290 [Vibrio coralliirubri]|uniref:hypothetical protein n=1 Tax=Vibrio coralliirubri TaxID=1516159 RepID=UPI0022847E18|nr:hypothetical protein [Vibrio coralliirubri]MCY9865056.1 hypothetical protein [Vibrio coralliirubri]
MNQLTTSGKRLSNFLCALNQLINTYPKRHARVVDSLGLVGWSQLEQLIAFTATAKTESEYKQALKLNHSFALFLKSNKTVEPSFRTALGRRGSAYVSNLIDLSMQYS